MDNRLLLLILLAFIAYLYVLYPCFRTRSNFSVGSGLGTRRTITRPFRSADRGTLAPGDKCNSHNDCRGDYICAEDKRIMSRTAGEKICKQCAFGCRSLKNASNADITSACTTCGGRRRDPRIQTGAEIGQVGCPVAGEGFIVGSDIGRAEDIPDTAKGFLQGHDGAPDGCRLRQLPINQRSCFGLSDEEIKEQRCAWCTLPQHGGGICTPTDAHMAGLQTEKENVFYNEAKEARIGTEYVNTPGWGQSP